MNRCQFRCRVLQHSKDFSFVVDLDAVVASTGRLNHVISVLEAMLQGGQGLHGGGGRGHGVVYVHDEAAVAAHRRLDLGEASVGRRVLGDHVDTDVAQVRGDVGAVRALVDAVPVTATAIVLTPTRLG